jgi:Zn-dependent membrane protease YugP
VKDSASAQNTIVAFYQAYSMYRYLYFATGKQWSKDLLNSKGVTNQHTSIAKAGVNVMIGLM